MNSRFYKVLISVAAVAACAVFVLSSIPINPVQSSSQLNTDNQNAKNAIAFRPDSSSSSVMKPVSGKPNSSSLVKPVSGKPSSSSVNGKPNTPSSFKKLKDRYNLVAISTYDGSNQLTHPKVLYFPKEWNGYKYWMSMTPYPGGNDKYENPSIVVSNDGNTWSTPSGLKNPVSGIPTDVKTGGHYSDPQLVMNGDTMELWYRYNPSLPNKKNIRLPNNAINTYYRKLSKDGIHWTAAQKLMQSRDGHLSLCVNYEEGMYKTWYATYGGDLRYSESKDAINWSNPVFCSVGLPKGFVPYHQDMIKNGSDYYLLQTAERKANYTFDLFLASSKDGIHFGTAQQLLPNKDAALWKGVSFYRSTLFVKDNKLDLFVSLIIPRAQWYMTKMTIPLPPVQDTPIEKVTGKTVVI